MLSRGYSRPKTERRYSDLVPNSASLTAETTVDDDTRTTPGVLQTSNCAVVPTQEPLNVSTGLQARHQNVKLSWRCFEVSSCGCAGMQLKDFANSLSLKQCACLLAPTALYRSVTTQFSHCNFPHKDRNQVKHVVEDLSKDNGNDQF